MKNRFGSVNELGLFEMHERGMVPVENPSELLLSTRARNVPGSCVHCAIEGSRPMLVDVQALALQTAYGTPRRTTNGFDAGRLALLLAVPLGLFTAVYLNEYAKRGNKLVNVIRITTETLSGIPSIVYGLFGMLFFVTRLHWGYSLLAGAMTLAIMILPLIMRTAEEALMAVPSCSFLWISVTSIPNPGRTSFIVTL